MHIPVVSVSSSRPTRCNPRPPSLYRWRAGTAAVYFTSGLDLSYLTAQAVEMKQANCIWIWKSTVHGLACSNQFHNQAGGNNRPHCWCENTSTYTHAHAYTTNTLSLSIIPVFPGADMELYHPFTSVVFTPASLKPSNRLRHWFPPADRCEHMLTHGEALELHHSFSIHHVPVCSTWNSALLLMDQCSVNLGQKQGGGKKGRHMAVGCCVQLLLMICLHASCGRNYFGGSLACLSSLWGDTLRNRRSTFLAKAKKANLSWHCSDNVSATTD